MLTYRKKKLRIIITHIIYIYTSRVAYPLEIFGVSESEPKFQMFFTFRFRIDGLSDAFLLNSSVRLQFRSWNFFRRKFFFFWLLVQWKICVKHFQNQNKATLNAFLVNFKSYAHYLCTHMEPDRFLTTCLSQTSHLTALDPWITRISSILIFQFVLERC